MFNSLENKEQLLQNIENGRCNTTFKNNYKFLYLDSFYAKMKIKFAFLLWICCLVSLAGKTQTQPKITFSLFEDTTASLNLSEVLLQYHQKNFETLSFPSFNPGYTESVFWLAVETEFLPNQSQWLLTIDNPHINRLSWYHLNKLEKEKLLYQTGDFYPFKQRPYPEFTNFAFPINPIDGLYLLKVDKRKESLQVPINVVKYDELAERYIKGNLINGILSGTIVMMIFFSLTLWISTYKKIYLFYALYIGSLLLWIWSNKGLGFEYFWYNSSFFPSRARPISLLLNIVFSIQFMQLFIGQTKNNFLFYPNKALQVIAIIFLLFILYPTPYENSIITAKYVQSMLTVVSSIQVLLLFASVIGKIRKGVKEAKFYLIAYLVLAFCGLAEQLYMYGTIMLNYYAAQFALLGGLVIEASILIYGLAQKFNRYRKEREILLFEKSEQQKTLTETIVNVQEKERKIFADRLHDEIGAMLSVVALHLNSLKKSSIEKSEDKLAEADQMLTQVANTVRTMSHQISPVTIDKIGFVKALESLVASINQTDKMYIELVCMGFEQTENYPTNYLNSIYRIIQELLQNIIKHAQATNAIIQLIEHEDIVAIMAEDNGLGLTPERLKNPKGSGMNSIFSKVNYLKGTIEIETPGNGTLINIELPNQNLNK